MSNKVILLVEDNPDDRLLTVRALKRHNLSNTIVEARDGEEALHYLHATGPYADRDIHDQPQVVLLDLKLPKIDGLEVLQRMRAHPATHRTPVVVLTSSNEQRDMIASYDLGANSYVRKPVDFEEFLTAARQLGMYWLLLNEVPNDR